MKYIEHKVHLIDERESLLESIVSDMVTFGSLLLCIWISMLVDSTVWMVLTVTLFVAFSLTRIVAGAQSRSHKFHSFEELEAWAREMRKLKDE